jgi:exopolysaccharide biosynthesis protein
MPKVPWSIHVAKIERARADLELRSTLARGKVEGLSTLVQQVQALSPAEGQPIAAINGDFYVVDEKNPYLGDPRGLQILDGELVSAPTDQASFWIDATGQPQATNVLSQLKVTWANGSSTPIGLNEERREGAAVLYTPRHGASTRTKGGRELILEATGGGPWLPLQAGREFNGRVRETRTNGNTTLSDGVLVLSLSTASLTNAALAAQAMDGAVLKISTATIPDLAGVKMAISGGYVLLRDGRKQEIQTPQSDAYKYRSVNERHPRAAIGASREHIFLVEVDGRQPELSMGMTLGELGDYMQKLGCELALSLDGGASATFWYQGKVLNSPCNGADRPIANGIVVVAKPAVKQP